MEKTMRVMRPEFPEAPAEEFLIEPDLAILAETLEEYLDYSTPSYDTIWELMQNISVHGQARQKFPGECLTTPSQWLTYWTREIGAEPFLIARTLLAWEWSPYGEKRLDYLLEKNPPYLSDLIETNRLAEHLMEVQKVAEDRMDGLMKAGIEEIRRQGREPLREIPALQAQMEEIVEQEEIYID